MRKFARALWIVGMFLAVAAPAQEATVQGTVHVNHHTLFVLSSGIEKLTPEERAEAISRRLQVIANSPPGSIETRLENSEEGVQILIGNQVIVTVTASDAKAQGITTQELAAQWAETIKGGITQSSKEEAWRTTLQRVLLSILIFGVAIGLVILLRRARRVLAAGLHARRERIPAIRFRGLQLVSPASIVRTLGRLLWLIFVGASIVVGVTALLLVFAQIPETRGYTYQIFLWMWDPFVAIVRGALGYLPNLFYILVIVFVARAASSASSRGSMPTWRGRRRRSSRHW